MTLRTTKEIYSDQEEMAKLRKWGFVFDDGFIEGTPEVDFIQLRALLDDFTQINVSKQELVILNYE